MNHERLRELLEDTHRFPGIFFIKVIGAAQADFAADVVAAAQRGLAVQESLHYTVRSSRGARYESVTLELKVSSPQQILDVYDALHAVRGIRFVF